MNDETGKWLMLLGALLLIAGLFIYFFHDKLQWIGRLPGDIRIEKEHVRFYFPITTMLLVSGLITLLVNIVKKIMQ